MAKTGKKEIKKRAANYKPKFKFDGSIKDLVAISIKDVNKKKSSPDKMG